MLRFHHLKAGAAEVDITPPAGIPLTGFIARLGPSTGIHDPLSARALALSASGQLALLVSCDLLALDAHFVAAARTAIREATGIPETHILIACTHTHSGPATIFLQDCGEVDPIYLNRLRLALVEAARKAVANLQEATADAGHGYVALGVLNRRQPGAPIDPELGVLGFRTETGRLLAILVNYACHPVCLDHTNRLISADYPGFLVRALQEQTGAVALFVNGATGDINPQQMGGSPFARELGQALAAETLRILDSLAYRDTDFLRVNSETLDLPLGPPPTEDEITRLISTHRQGLAQAESARDALTSKIHKAMLGWAEAIQMGVLQGTLPATAPAEIQLVCLGEAALVGIPGEMFSELGKQIKETISSRQVMVLGYANSDIGYIPTRQAYALGGYEIDEAYKYYGYPAALAPAAGDLVKQSAARLWAECTNRVG